MLNLEKKKKTWPSNSKSRFFAPRDTRPKPMVPILATASLIVSVTSRHLQAHHEIVKFSKLKGPLQVIDWQKKSEECKNGKKKLTK